MTDREWDAATYDRIADPMTRWGAVVLDRLPLRGDERVLDAGCGTGRVTELLLERVPDGHVVALDASSRMLTEAGKRLGRFGDRVELVHADLLEPIPTDPVDAVVSTATLHWIDDHDALFRNLATVLRPGGRLAAQGGGVGNIRRVFAAVAAVLGEVEEPVTFATPEETAARLRRAGFSDIRCWLHDEPTPIGPGAPLETYLRTVCVRTWADRMSAAEQERFVRAVAERIPDATIDYVRLNIDATKAS